MQFKKIFPYNIKKAVPMLALAGATLLPACKKIENEKPYTGPKHDVELPFTVTTGDERLSIEILQQYINDPSVESIYMVAEGDWDRALSENIAFFCDNFMRPRIKMSPKLRGRGDFNFKLGEAAKVPSDSLWLTQQGWTINKKYQKQK